MKAIIYEVYYWFWHDFMLRKEPYTNQARRQVAVWWGLWVLIAMVATGIFIWRAYKSKRLWTWIVIGVMGSGFITWFLLHLGGFS